MKYENIKKVIDSLQPGDLVRLTLNDTVLIDRVKFISNTPALSDILGSGEVSLSRLIQRGYDIEIAERAELKLPDQAGIYATKSGDMYVQLYVSDDDSSIEDAIWLVTGGRSYRYKDLPYDFLPLRLVELAPSE
jgi:hypothetical protein